ncbi:MAG TPA: alpha/beta hydrolase [Anseongella sp.]
MMKYRRNVKKSINCCAEIKEIFMFGNLFPIIKKITLPVFLLIFAVGVQNSVGQRYLEEVFSKVDSVPDVIYGQAINYQGENQSLFFDFYSPYGDTSRRRPLLIYAHGGGFGGGSRKYPSIGTMCEKLARRGYAVANISYRLDPHFDYSKSDTNRRAITDAMHDMRAAVRFFKANQAKYGIDTSNIFIGGESAGAVTAMTVGYVNKKSDLKAYPKTSPYNLEGNSGTPGYSSKVKSVLCLCGTIPDTTAMDSPDDPPLLWVHGSSDPIVSFSLAEEILERAENIGISYQKRVFEGATHCPWIKTLPNSELYLDSLVNYMSQYMHPLITEGKL